MVSENQLIKEDCMARKLMKLAMATGLIALVACIAVEWQIFNLFRKELGMIVFLSGINIFVILGISTFVYERFARNVVEN